jgi:hypothetical protein
MPEEGRVHPRVSRMRSRLRVDRAKPPAEGDTLTAPSSR